MQIQPAVLGACLVAGLLSGCADTSSNTVTESKSPTSTATPTSTDLERDEKRQQEGANREAAIKEFVMVKFKGWTLQATSGRYGETCEAAEPCDVYLVKGRESKVVAVVVKEFHRANGTSFWAAFPARSIDLALAKLDEIKAAERDAERDDILANLDWDQCQDICESQFADRAAEYQDYDPPDYP